MKDDRKSRESLKALRCLKKTVFMKQFWSFYDLKKNSSWKLSEIIQKDTSLNFYEANVVLNRWENFLEA